MKKERKLTRDDYNALFSGRVRYLVTLFQTFNYGRCNQECFQYYSVMTTLGGGLPSLPVWSKEDTQAFIKEHKLSDGDRETMYYIAPCDSNTIYWCAGGNEYIVLNGDFIKIGEYKGE